LYRRFNALGIVLMAVIDLALFGVVGMTLWAVQMLWIPFWAAGVINGIGHYWGYRNYEPADASTNIAPLGILIGGEELHNNHHAFPSSAKFSSKPWELDLGWFYIRILSLLKLAKVKRVAPKLVIVPNKRHVDKDTVTAIIVNRLHIMAGYAREVILPTLSEEWQKADDSCKRLLKHARRVLVREESLVDDKGRERLDDVLKLSERLRTVYEFRQRLQAIWGRSATSHEALLKNLLNWCSQAEASGIKVLQEFSLKLRSCSLQPV
jgi:stearoyl-CoA desaturase (delta-9 desaturase)